MNSNSSLKPTLIDLTYWEVAVVILIAILIVSFLVGMIATPKVKDSPLKQDGSAEPAHAANPR
jgi:hypothetical protein